ncbi:MAG: LacI family transcriptional regulator, partial [Actinotalea sp.]|nr:LacI family transcriptional regulator [Actinotalea sp.]
MRRKLAAAAASVAVLALAACGGTTAPADEGTTESAPAAEEGGDGGDEAITVGFSQVGSESGWRAANTKSIQETLTAENGFDLKFSDAQQQQELQIEAIRTYIAQGVDVIAFSPVVETG